MIIKNYILTAIAFFVAIISSFGQGSNEYIAVDDYQRTINRSEKISTKPQLNDSVIELPKIKYYIEPTYQEVTFETKPIKAAKLKIKEPLTKIYNGYIKAGLGLYTTPFLDAYYGSNRSKTKSWGINVKHYSSLTNLKNVGHNLFSDNEANLFYKHFFKKNTFYNNINYERNKYHYYGFDANDSLTIPEDYRTSKTQTKQIYQTIKYNAMLKSMHNDSAKINHTTDFNYYYLNGKTGINEHDFVIKSNIYKYLEREEVGADVSLSINHLTQNAIPFGAQTLLPVSNKKYGNSIFKINPFIKTRRGNLLAKVGVGVHTEITHVARFFFYPDLNVSYSLFNDIFVPYAGLTGGMQKNTFNSFRSENPYVKEDISTRYLDENVAYRNSNQRINIFGGFRGSVSSTVSFNLKAQFEKIHNFAMFVNDTLSSYENKFAVRYDSIDKTTLSAQLGYQLKEKIKLSIYGAYYNYSMLEEDYAWQKPDFTVGIAGIYDLSNKIIARLNVTVIGTRKAYSLKPIEGVEINQNGKYIYDLKPYVDANLGIEYRYNKRLSAFLNLNNMLGKKYQEWANYPVYSFNLLGGITYSF